MYKDMSDVVCDGVVSAGDLGGWGKCLTPLRLKHEAALKKEVGSHAKPLKVWGKLCSCLVAC